MWDLQADALATDHRVVVIEPRGHGAAAAPPGPYTLADLAADVLDVTDRLEFDRFHLAGISLGGITALWVAAHHPERIGALTVADTAARVGTADFWTDRIAVVRAGGMPAICDVVMERFFSPGFRQTHRGVVDGFRDVCLRVDPQGYAGCCHALAHGDVTAELTHITAPTLVIGGTADVATPPEQARDIHDAIASSRLELLEGAGHLSNLERPDEFTRLLRDHVTAASHP